MTGGRPSAGHDPSPRLVLNPAWKGPPPFAAVEHVLPHAAMIAAGQAIRAWPDYDTTPLRNLAGLAEEIGIGQVLCKDESQRFGLGGVKVLGAPYGLTQMIAGDAGLRALPPAELEAVAATDGNHGLALAWAMARVGGRSRIFVGNEVDLPRITRLSAAGATVERLAGTYDDAVCAAERHAGAAPHRLLVSDTDYDGGNPVTRAIMAGYSVLGQELRDQLQGTMPTHMFLQCGVGGMASGVLCGLWHGLQRLDIKLVLVEPLTAACLQESLERGKPSQVPGTLSTRMMGLSCGRPSLPAWQILRVAAFAAIAIGDDLAARVQHDLQGSAFGDEPVQVGDTGVAGLAGLVAAARNFRSELGLDAHSRVLCVNTEAPLRSEA